MLNLSSHSGLLCRNSLSPCTYSSRRIFQQHTRPSKAFATNGPLLAKPKAHRDSGTDPGLEKPKIKWYQQLLPWSTKRTRIDGEIGFAAGELYDEAKWLKDQIQKDDVDLREMEGRGGKTMIEPLLATLPKEGAQKVRDAIKKEDVEDARKEKEAEVLERRLTKLLPKQKELEIRWELPRKQYSYLKTLNENILKTCSNIASRELRRNLWQSYMRCKAFLPPFLHLIPEKSWSILWASQQTATPDDPHWAPHMITLSEDMIEAGKKLDVYQRILYIEALNSQDHQEKAIEQWQELEQNVKDDKRASEELELLGVRLFASHGDPEKAEKIALNYLGKDKQDESRILIPILRAWAQRGDDIGIKHAWALYLRFRTDVGEKITMEDYDNISMGFLDVGRTDIALAVFKDMMLTGQQTDQGSLELYKRSLAMIGRTQSSAVTVEDLNRISLTGLIVLPRRFQNKFFYGSWLKKLIGMGAVDAAAQVIELMYERGVKPDTKHLNGIIGAWFRSGRDKERKDAEKMAWAMIHERLDIVKSRQNKPKSNSSQLPSIAGLPIAPHVRRNVAPASIETFSLLLQYYGHRAQDHNIQIIKETLKTAEIPPNNYFINHLLYIDLRRGEHQAAWIKYKGMFGTVKPDLETFACLWDCEKAHIDSLMLHTCDKFPNPRQIMREMMTWFSYLSAKPGGSREAVKEEFSRELYEQIIRCMGLASDLPGIIVALYALRESFGFYPDANINRLVNLQVSRIQIGRPYFVARSGRHRPGKPNRKANANRIAQVFGLVIQEREAVLAQHGLGEVAQFDDDVQREEGLFRIAEFLRAVLRRISTDEHSVETKIEKAAWEMGVSGVNIEDPLPSYKGRKDMYRISNGE